MTHTATAFRVKAFFSLVRIPAVGVERLPRILFGITANIPNATLQRRVIDPYVRAIRFASDRIVETAGAFS
jgi:hypothetical protein